jgi:Valyl-tRNA synthetase
VTRAICWKSKMMIDIKILTGKNVVLPFVGRKIPILADEYVDMNLERVV